MSYPKTHIDFGFGTPFQYFRGEKQTSFLILNAPRRAGRVTHESLSSAKQLFRQKWALYCVATGLKTATAYEEGYPSRLMYSVEKNTLESGGSHPETPPAEAFVLRAGPESKRLSTGRGKEPWAFSPSGLYQSFLGNEKPKLQPFAQSLEIGPFRSRKI